MILLTELEESSESEIVAGEAYQIIGSLSHYANMFDHPEVQRALDWFSGFEPGITYKDNASILPWPKEELKPDDYSALAARIEALEEALSYYADIDCWTRVVVPSRGSHADYDIEDDFWRWDGDNNPTETARSALSLGREVTKYSIQEHIAHDIRMGRFPKRSTREQYETEARSALAKKEG